MFKDLIAKAAQHAAIPASCLVCNAWGTAGVCGQCVIAFTAAKHRCTSCAAPLASIHALRCGACLSLGSGLDACVAAVDYAYPWDGLIQRFKYADFGDLSAAPAIGRPLAHVMRTLAQSRPDLHAALDRALLDDWIMGVPLHQSRQQSRGFNQAYELTKALFPRAKHIRSDLLLRLKATAVQASLPLDARMGNLKNAFAVSPAHAHEIRDRSITLIDDVATTTATLQAAAMALRQAGAKAVHAIVFARAA